MKIELIITATGRRVLATKQQADLLMKLGKAELAKKAHPQDEEKDLKAAPAANGKPAKGYNRRDMAKKTESK